MNSKCGFIFKLSLDKQNLIISGNGSTMVTLKGNLKVKNQNATSLTWIYTLNFVHTHRKFVKTDVAIKFEYAI